MITNNCSRIEIAPIANIRPFLKWAGGKFQIINKLLITRLNVSYWKLRGLTGVK